MSVWVVLLIVILITLLYQVVSLSVLLTALFSFFALTSLIWQTNVVNIALLWLGFALIISCFGLASIRKGLFSRYFYPATQQTDLTTMAAEATIMFDQTDWLRQLLSGMPNWQQLLVLPQPQLSTEEKTFINGPLVELCTLIDDWDISHNFADIPTHVWQYLKRHGFFGLLIPKDYAGLAFSVFATQHIIEHLAGYSIAVAHTVNAANTQGLALLLLDAGSDEQKHFYLPRLAKGDDISSVALTDVNSTSILDTGIVCRGNFRGQSIVGIRLNWSAENIALAPVATLLVLAFNLKDPEHLLGDKENLGVTCAMLMTHLPGISIGRRHLALHVAFQCGPIEGNNVFIPLDWIIGGQSQIGKSQRMLINYHTGYKQLLLPSLVVGQTKTVAAITGAFVRSQCLLKVMESSIKGIEHNLTAMLASTYLSDALNRMLAVQCNKHCTAGLAAVVVTQQVTSHQRHVINAAMDIQADQAVCLGPQNYLGAAYQAVPLMMSMATSTQVSDAILMRQAGYYHDVAQAMAEDNEKQAVTQSAPIWQKTATKLVAHHVRAVLLGITQGRLDWNAPRPFQRYFQQLSRMSTILAVLVWACQCKRIDKQKRIALKLSIILSDLYAASSLLQQSELAHSSKESILLIEWCCNELLDRMQNNIRSVIDNFPLMRWRCWLRFILFPTGYRRYKVKEASMGALASILSSPNEIRERLFARIDLSSQTNNPVGQLHDLWEKVISVEPLLNRVYNALQKEGDYSKDFNQNRQKAIAMGIISQHEADLLASVEQMHREILAFDSFSTAELTHKRRSVRRQVVCDKENLG